MVDDANRQSHTDSLPIEGMARLSPHQLQALKSRWITTINAFVAATATEESRAGLCQALDVELEALDDMLRDARDSLGEERYRDLQAPRPGGPTGALLDDDQQQRIDGPVTGDEGA